MQYRRRVEVVDTLQYDGTNQAAVIALAPELIKMSNDGTQLLINMFETWTVVSAGMWVLVDASGAVSAWPGETFNDFWQPGGAPA